MKKIIIISLLITAVVIAFAAKSNSIVIQSSNYTTDYLTSSSNLTDTTKEYSFDSKLNSGATNVDIISYMSSTSNTAGLEWDVQIPVSGVWVTVLNNSNSASFTIEKKTLRNADTNLVPGSVFRIIRAITTTGDACTLYQQVNTR